MLRIYFGLEETIAIYSPLFAPFFEQTIALPANDVVELSKCKESPYPAKLQYDYDL